MAGEMINTVLKAEDANRSRIEAAQVKAGEIISGAADEAEAAARAIIIEARAKASAAADRAAKDAAAVDADAPSYDAKADPDTFERAVIAAIDIITQKNHV